MEQVKVENILDLKLKNLTENMPDDSLNKRICIFGHGFIGLPLALSFSLRGCSVIGVDIDKGLVDDINRGTTHHYEMLKDITIQQILKRELYKSRYLATTDAGDAVRTSSNIIVTVGVPVVEGRCLTGYLAQACMTIGKNLKKDDLVIIRSTVIPGTTEEILMPILENESGMRGGIDFYLAYSPERVAEGRTLDEFVNMPTLVAGVNKESAYRAAELLGIVCKAKIIEAGSIKEAEISKLFENVQRDVNIALAQEFARFTEAMGVDIFEVVKLANTHKRVNILTPGPGVGGYCIPNAFHYLEPKARQLSVDLDIIKLCRSKNADMPGFITSKVEELLGKAGKSLSQSKIAILGIAMKDYSNDSRMSPAIDIAEILLKKGGRVDAFDPRVQGLHSFKVHSQDAALAGADAVILLSRQHGINYDDLVYMAGIMNENPVYLDTKSVVDRQEAEGLGFIYWRL